MFQVGDIAAGTTVAQARTRPASITPLQGTPNRRYNGANSGTQMSAFGVLKYINGHPLTSDRKLSALLRFAKWQIGSRLVPGAVSFDWVGGTKLLVRPG